MTCGRVDALYTEMASRHRVRAHALQIIKIAEVANEDVRRDNTRQFLADDVSSRLSKSAQTRLQVSKDSRQIPTTELCNSLNFYFGYVY